MRRTRQSWPPAPAMLAIVLLAGCGGAPTPPTSPADPSSVAALPGTSAPPSGPGSVPAAVVAGRRADLDQLLERLVAVHPNPFLDEGEAAFRERIASLSERAATLSDAGFLVGIMELMGHRERDGHSGAWALAQTGDRLHAWPIHLWDFPDGLRIVAAREPHDDLVGARVIAVGGTPVAVAREAVEPIVPRDNPSSLRANLPIYLTLPEVLAERGVLQPGAADLTLEMPDGSTRDVEMEPLPIEAYRDWIFGVYGGSYPTGFPPDPDGIRTQRHRSAVIWSEALPGGGAYVGYNEVRANRGPEGSTVGEVAADVVDGTDAGDATPLIVDLRINGGGDNNTYGLLRSAIVRRAHASPGTVALLTGRDTFSAAGNFVTDLKVGPSADGILLVGEAPGGGPNIYGDVEVVTLESSGIVVLISGRYHERRPGDDSLEVVPDIAAEPTWPDVQAHRDVVLDAAVAATSGSASR